MGLLGVVVAVICAKAASIAAHTLSQSCMRVALCQVNPTVGQVRQNAQRVLAWCLRAHAEGASLAVFPELALIGYPPRDLVHDKELLWAQRDALDSLARALPAELAVIVGYAEQTEDGSIYNAAALLHQETIAQRARKQLLPNYDVFSEHRYFRAGLRTTTATIGNAHVGITICEDIFSDEGRMSEWTYANSPLDECVRLKTDLVVNIAASPFTLAKHRLRHEVMSELAVEARQPVIFVNQCGANDGLIFDGRSLIAGPDGKIWRQAASFREDLVVVDLDAAATSSAQETTPPSDEDDAQVVLQALTLGLKDFTAKTGLTKCVVGLSGGIDSAVTAALAARAVGGGRVIGVSMPSRYTSSESMRDARGLASNLGLEFHQVDIDPIFQLQLQQLPSALQTQGLVEENLQSRLRMVTLMAFSNSHNALLLNTGNKSEAAVGYTTLYGDMAGGLCPIGDLYKSMVYRLARAINQQGAAPVIPQHTLSRPPSAELRAGQLDQDSLPDYALLDGLLQLHIEERKTLSELVEAGYERHVATEVLGMIERSEYKRAQMPPALIVSKKAFGIGRLMPIAARIEH